MPMPMHAIKIPINFESVVVHFICSSVPIIHGAYQILSKLNSQIVLIILINSRFISIIKGVHHSLFKCILEVGQIQSRTHLCYPSIFNRFVGIQKVVTLWL